MDKIKFQDNLRGEGRILNEKELVQEGVNLFTLNMKLKNTPWYKFITKHKYKKQIQEISQRYNKNLVEYCIEKIK